MTKWERFVKRLELVAVHWLRARGWIVFWLDADQRCRTVCFLELYRQEQQRDQGPPPAAA